MFSEGKRNIEDLYRLHETCPPPPPPKKKKKKKCSELPARSRASLTNSCNIVHLDLHIARVSCCGLNICTTVFKDAFENSFIQLAWNKPVKWPLSTGM